MWNLHPQITVSLQLMECNFSNLMILLLLNVTNEYILLEKIGITARQQSNIFFLILSLHISLQIKKSYCSVLIETTFITIHFLNNFYYEKNNISRKVEQITFRL